MRITNFIPLALVLASCSLLSAYSITFTTLDGAVVDPATDTLDFVISSPALAYISAVECSGSEDLDLLPILTDDMKAKTAYNLPLTALVGQAPATKCDVTVMAFDQTTTSNSRSTISLVIVGEAVPVVEEGAAVETPVVEDVVPDEELVPEVVPEEVAPVVETAPVEPVAPVEDAVPAEVAPEVVE